MRNIKLTIRYDGTHYAGWQYQKNAKSIQGVIEGALKKILGEKVNLIGSGRTDSGVHAEAQVANFKTRSKIPLKNIKTGLNSILPKDILILNIENANPKFNAQHHAKGKLYLYIVSTDNYSDPFMRWFVGRSRYRLNIGAMKKAARYLIGKHDFRSFQTNNGSAQNNTIRIIENIKIEKDGNLVYIYIEANGFLYNMVRNIVGTLTEVGRGKIAADIVKKILSKRDRRFCGPTAPASGLRLVKVKY